MIHPTLEELFANVKKVKCPMCGRWMSCSWPARQKYMVLFCYDHQANVHLVIGANGTCNYQGQDCTYDQLLRLAKLKAFI